ncbi:hypothetical protein J2Z48_002966 [Croceifilum oryzae]|uniref:Uncharacterized protein n=1 Tax=Croceifilum oryzae TaxID=1553429 RepID=A0AAJ1TKW3_9BACL|nr:hypothetical protein [Croceifilum oryzae]MDQ0418762.1 hypothetical protein [Croceifilum oryzae]
MIPKKRWIPALILFGLLIAGGGFWYLYDDRVDVTIEIVDEENVPQKVDLFVVESGEMYPFRPSSTDASGKLRLKLEPSLYRFDVLTDSSWEEIDEKKEVSKENSKFRFVLKKRSINK